MTKKNTTVKKTGKNMYHKKLVVQKWEELIKWEAKNLTQKRFFSLEEKEQSLLKKTYIIFAQVCPELDWEDYLDRLRMSDKQDAVTKSVLKKVLWI